MGRKKIQIEKIKSEKDRIVTYCKRRYGFMKKAAELAILCDVGVYAVFTDINGKIYQFNSFPRNLEDGISISKPKLDDVLDKIRKGDCLKYQLQDYPFEGMKHHHNLDEFSRVESFVEQMDQDFGVGHLLDKRKPEINPPPKFSDPIIGNEKSLSKRLKNKRAKQSFPLTAAKTSVSILKELNKQVQGTSYAPCDALASDHSRLQGLIQNIKGEVSSYFSFNVLNLVKNDKSILDVLVYAFLLITYLELTLHPDENGNKSQGRSLKQEGARRILGMSSLEKVIELAKKFRVQEIVNNKNSLAVTQTVTEYFLRKFLNPWLGKTKQVSYVLLNGLVSTVRTFFHQVSSSISVLYSETTSESEDYFAVKWSTINRVNSLFDVTLHSMLLAEVERQEKLGKESLISVINPLAQQAIDYEENRPKLQVQLLREQIYKAQVKDMESKPNRYGLFEETELDSKTQHGVFISRSQRIFGIPSREKTNGRTDETSNNLKGYSAPLEAKNNDLDEITD